MIFRIIRNILSLLGGQIASKLFSLACIIFLARRLGVNEFGSYGVITTYIALLAVFADSGISTVTTRDVAKDLHRSDELFSHALALRLCLTSIIYVIAILIGSVGNERSFSRGFIMVIGLFLFSEAVRRASIAMLTAYERMDIVAGLSVVSTFLKYTPFIIAVLYGRSLQTAFTLLVVFWAVGAGISLIITKKYCLHHGSTTLKLHTMRTLLHESLPFGILLILSIIYFKADILMLAVMKGESAVGFYEGAYKFIEASMFIPTSIVATLLPVMSRMFVQDKDSYADVYVHSTRILAAGVLPFVIVVSLFAREIILLVYGVEYLPSTSALALLIWSLFVIFLNAPVGNVIATSGLIRAFLPYAIINTLLNILLNFVLIPRYSFLGASFTTLLTECTGFASQLWFAHTILGNASRILTLLGKLTIAGVLTALVGNLTRSTLPIPVSLLLLFAMYVASLLVLKIVTRQDKQLCVEFINTIKRKLWKEE